MPDTLDAPRHYWRCIDCLLPFVLPTAEPTGAACGCCGGHELEWMGQVNVRTRQLEKKAQECLCNEACAYARGPRCECACGGVHHGKSLQAFVEVVAEGRPIARIPAKSATLERARARAVEWRTELAAVLVLADAWRATLPGGRLPDGLYWERRTLNHLLAVARGRRSHGARMKDLAAARQHLTDISLA